MKQSDFNTTSAGIGMHLIYQHRGERSVIPEERTPKNNILRSTFGLPTDQRRGHVI
jgi:hypothetical protein